MKIKKKTKISFLYYKSAMSKDVADFFLHNTMFLIFSILLKFNISLSIVAFNYKIFVKVSKC